MATLYEIDRAISDVINTGFQIDAETGEIIFDENDLEALQADKEKKIDGCACYVKNLFAEVEALKAEETALAHRRKTKERRIEWLKRYIKQSLELDNMDEFETPRCKLSFRKSTVLEVDESRIPDTYVNEVVTRKPDKAKIKEALKLGAYVDGCKLVEKRNLQIK